MRDVRLQITQAMIGRAWHVTMGQLLHEGKESDPVVLLYPHHVRAVCVDDQFNAEGRDALHFPHELCVHVDVCVAHFQVVNR